MQEIEIPEDYPPPYEVIGDSELSLRPLKALYKYKGGFPPLERISNN